MQTPCGHNHRLRFLQLDNILKHTAKYPYTTAYQTQNQPQLTRDRATPRKLDDPQTLLDILECICFRNNHQLYFL